MIATTPSPVPCLTPTFDTPTFDPKPPTPTPPKPVPPVPRKPGPPSSNPPNPNPTPLKPNPPNPNPLDPSPLKLSPPNLIPLQSAEAATHTLAPPTPTKPKPKPPTKPTSNPPTPTPNTPAPNSPASNTPAPKEPNPAHVLGRRGEDLATHYVKAMGLVVLCRNWRCREGEIDILATDGDMIVVCEVKTRTSDEFGTPADAMNAKKIRHIRDATNRWLREYRIPYVAVRYDLAEVWWPRTGEPQIKYRRDAF